MLPMAPKTAMGFSERAIVAALALALAFAPGAGGAAELRLPGSDARRYASVSIT